jgi:hypothetical protein
VGPVGDSAAEARLVRACMRPTLTIAISSKPSGINRPGGSLV